jgi:hypothetical protein
MGTRRRSLELALRVREWTLQEQADGLRAAVSVEMQARHAVERAQRKVSEATVAHAQLQRGGTFHAEQILRLAQYRASVCEKATEMAAALDDAAADAQRWRERVQQTLGERDAFARSLQESHDCQAIERQRQQVREADDAWAVRGEYRA